MDKQYVGIDLHRRLSVVVRRTAASIGSLVMRTVSELVFELTRRPMSAEGSTAERGAVRASRPI